jgi:hypothetical protein
MRQLCFHCLTGDYKKTARQDWLGMEPIPFFEIVFQIKYEILPPPSFPRLGLKYVI